jgi:hypothetical protein
MTNVQELQKMTLQLKERVQLPTRNWADSHACTIEELSTISPHNAKNNNLEMRNFKEVDMDEIDNVSSVEKQEVVNYKPLVKHTKTQSQAI